MCHFVSWKEKNSTIYFLRDRDLTTKEGRELKKHLGRDYCADITGHGATERYYGITGGVNRECEDFSTPGNFPTEIVKAIKAGNFREIGYNVGLLNAKGKEAYENIQQPAREAYEKIRQPAWEEYKNIQRSAREAYEKIEQPAWEAYKKIQQPAYEVYKKIEQSAREACNKTIIEAFWDIFKNQKYRNKNWL